VDTFADNLPRMEHPTRWIQLGDDVAAGETVRFAKVATVDVGFFDAFGTPLLDGRGFDANDASANASVVLVNESFVEDVLGGTNPIGRRVRYRTGRNAEPSRWYEIVGVVGRAGMNIMEPDFDAGIYLPMAPGTVHPVRMALHLGSDPESFTPRLREIVAEVDPNALIASPVALNRIHEGDWFVGMAAMLGGLVAVGILLGLAGCGIFAIMSFSVAERTREIGIRTALGAQPAQVAWTVARRAMMQLAIGGVLGTPIAWWAFSAIREDAASGLTGSILALLPGLAVMLIVAFAACTAPTMRALRIEPTAALKE
jgi:hypothetical protein